MIDVNIFNDILLYTITRKKVEISQINYFLSLADKVKEFEGK